MAVTLPGIEASEGSGVGWSILALKAKFDRPGGIFVNQDDHIYMADYSNNRVVRVHHMTGMTGAGRIPWRLRGPN